MSYNPNNPNGSATSANSAPIVIASDQATIKTKLANDIAQTTGTITTAASVVTTGSLSGVGSATVQISGTYAGVNVTFEASIDNTNWVGIPAVQLASANPTATLTSGVLTNNTVIWNIGPLLGVQYIRVRATAWTSGTANIIIQPSAQFAAFNVNAIVTSAPTTAVTLATNTPTLQTGANIVGKVGIDQTTIGTTNAVSLAQLGTGTIATGNGTSSTGTLRVAIASDQTTNTNPLLFKQAITATSSGMIVSKVLAAAATTPVQIKTTAGQIYGWHFVNNATSTRYVRFFNVSTSPTMGTTSPTFVIPLPGSGGAVLSPDNAGIPMATGIFYSITTGATDLDNTAPAANDVVGTIFSV